MRDGFGSRPLSLREADVALNTRYLLMVAAGRGTRGNGFSAVQVHLGAALALNVPNGEDPHVVVALPSFSVGESLLSHNGDRIPSLEHRYLVAMFLLSRFPAERLVFVASRAPSGAVIEHYFSMMPDAAIASARDRFEMVIDVEDDSARPVAANDQGALDALRDAIGSLPALIEPWNVAFDEAALSCALGVPINGAAPELRPLGFKGRGRRQLMQTAGVPVPRPRPRRRRAQCPLRAPAPRLAAPLARARVSGWR